MFKNRDLHYKISGTTGSRPSPPPKKAPTESCTVALCIPVSVASWNVHKFRRLNWIWGTFTARETPVVAHNWHVNDLVQMTTCNNRGRRSPWGVCSCWDAPTRGTPPSPSSLSSSPHFPSPHQNPRIWAHRPPYLPSSIVVFIFLRIGHLFLLRFFNVELDGKAEKFREFHH